MADFFSQRFGKNVWVTRHARHSMRMRNVDDRTLEQLIERGEVKRQGDRHLWIYMHVDERTDNLVCAAAVELEAVIIKTVMINWQLEDES